jgi:hypothetical protein
MPQLTLFWLPSLLPSAIATATTDADVSTAVNVNATAAVSFFTDIGLCFCHYPHHHFCMGHSHPDHCFCHSCCRFLSDCCLTHHYHCSADAIANATTNATAAIRCPPKPPLMSRCCHLNCCRCATGAAFVFKCRRILFAPAGCHAACRRAASIPLDVLTPLDAPLPTICPVGCRMASHNASAT